jgi:hypothetical protein
VAREERVRHGDADFEHRTFAALGAAWNPSASRRFGTKAIRLGPVEKVT